MKVLIVEDEIMAQKSLTRLLMQNFSDMSVVGYTDSIKSTVSWLRTEGNSADIIFKDFYNAIFLFQGATALVINIRIKHCCNL